MDTRKGIYDNITWRGELEDGVRTGSDREQPVSSDLEKFCTKEGKSYPSFCVGPVYIYKETRVARERERRRVKERNRDRDVSGAHSAQPGGGTLTSPAPQAPLPRG